MNGREKPLLELTTGRSRLAFKIDNGVLSGELLLEFIKWSDTLIRMGEGARNQDQYYSNDNSYVDTSPMRYTHRPSEFFEKYYSNDEPVFNPNFGTPDIKSNQGNFKSPGILSKRSISPFDTKLDSIVEERESEINRSTIIGGKARASRAPKPVRYSSQVRFSDLPGGIVRGRRTDNDDSPRSLNRLTDNFYGFNRFTNQPTQRSNQRSHLNQFMEDEIARSDRYAKIKKIDFKKKSLSEMVDEVVLEKESIYFNPDNKPISIHEHNFQGDTPSRGTKDSRVTYDPYSISPLQERVTSSNNFNFKESWDKKRRENTNMTFGTLSATKNEKRETTHNRPSNYSSYQELSFVKNRLSRSPMRSSVGFDEYVTNQVEKSNHKLDNVNVSHLAQLTNNYFDDYGRKISQRYFCLIHGDPIAVDVQFSINIFKKSEKEKIDAKMSIIVKNIHFEYTNDWIKNIAKTVLSFHLENIHNRFLEIIIRPDRNEYQRKIEFHTMLMYLTKRNFEDCKKEFKKLSNASNVEKAGSDFEDDLLSRMQHK